MKKLLLLSCAMILVVLNVSTAFAIAPLNLKDVPANDPDRQAIEYLNQHDVIYGFIDGTFKPDRNVTRAEFLKIVLEASGQGSAVLKQLLLINNYSDVPNDHTLSRYILYGTNHNIVSGYPNGTFRPENTVSRAEATKIVANTFHALGDSTCTGFSGEHSYVDVKYNSNSLSQYVFQLYDLNWFRPSGTYYSPGRPLLRREAAQMIYRAIVTSTINPTCPVQFTNQSAPATTSADWQTIGTQFHLSIPPSWHYKDNGNTILVDPVMESEVMVEGVLFGFSVDQDMTPLDAKLRANAHVESLVINPVYIGNGTISIYEYIYHDEAIELGEKRHREMEWIAGDKHYQASMWTEFSPYLGAFYRIVQNAATQN